MLAASSLEEGDRPRCLPSLPPPAPPREGDAAGRAAGGRAGARRPEGEPAPGSVGRRAPGSPRRARPCPPEATPRRRRLARANCVRRQKPKKTHKKEKIPAKKIGNRQIQTHKNSQKHSNPRPVIGRTPSPPPAPPPEPDDTDVLSQRLSPDRSWFGREPEGAESQRGRGAGPGGPGMAGAWQKQLGEAQRLVEDAAAAAQVRPPPPAPRPPPPPAGGGGRRSWLHLLPEGVKRHCRVEPRAVLLGEQLHHVHHQRALGVSRLHVVHEGRVVGAAVEPGLTRPPPCGRPGRRRRGRVRRTRRARSRPAGGRKRPSRKRDDVPAPPAGGGRD